MSGRAYTLRRHGTPTWLEQRQEGERAARLGALYAKRAADEQRAERAPAMRLRVDMDRSRGVRIARVVALRGRGSGGPF
jgi:hypothetical protein